jgi:hypothetical protein
VKRALLPLALLAGACDHGASKSPLELKKETIRRLDAGSVEPIPVSSPAPQPENWPQPVQAPDAGAPDARMSPPTNQAPVTNQKR